MAEWKKQSIQARRLPKKKDGVNFSVQWYYQPEKLLVWTVFAAKQLGASFYAYIYDRVTGAYALPDLADIIRERTPAFHPLLCGWVA